MSEEQTERREETSNIIRLLDSVLRHIEHVRENCELLGRKYIEKGEIDFGLQLIRRGLIHDNSKLSKFEFTWLNQTENKTMLKEAIRAHSQSNDHHIQAWGDIEQMPKIAICEMTADICARSREFGQDIREYISKEFLPKNEISKNSRAHKQIMEAVNFLLEKPFQKL